MILKLVLKLLLIVIGGVLILFFIPIIYVFIGLNKLSGKKEKEDLRAWI